MWKYVFGFISGTFGGAFVGYVVGRILLPELGLTAPGYWAWYWAVFILVISKVVFSYISEWMDR